MKINNEKPDQQKEYLKHTITYLRDQLNQIFEDSGDFYIEFSDRLKVPFDVNIERMDAHAVKRRFFRVENHQIERIDVSKTQEKVNRYKLNIKIGFDFESIKDIPKLVRNIQEIYEANYLNDLDQLLKIDTKEQYKNYWLFMSKKIENYFNNNSNDLLKNQDIKHILYDLVIKIRNIGLSFGNNNTTDLSKIEIPEYFNIEWKKLEERLDNIFHRIIEKKNKKPRKFGMSMIRSILERLINSYGKTEIIEKLNLQAINSIIHFFEQEFFKKVKLSEISNLISSDENTADIISYTGDGSTTSSTIEWMNKHFPRDANILEKLKKNLREAKNNKSSVEEISSLQKKIISKIRLLTMSYKIYLFKEGRFSVKSAVESNFVNCVMVSKIIHLLWYYYTEEQSLSVLKSEHIHEVIKLANGELIDTDIGDNLDEGTYFNIGDHNTLYLASLLNLKARTENRAREKARLYRLALKLAPNNPGYMTNLANLLGKYPRKHEEAERLFRKVLEIDPNNYVYMKNLASFLYYELEKYKESEELYLKSLSINPNDMHAILLLYSLRKKMSQAKR